jgi:L-ribulose-5-phosphate 4-epimerase
LIMDIQRAKQSVIAAGRQLVEKGLIARTWGNVSCRFGEEQFLITPSGRAYQSLTEEEIVAVKLEDLSYDGDVEPSSEKGVHAAIYRKRKDADFIIHTHQPYASAVSPLELDIPVKETACAALIGKRVVSVPYGLSGTGKLINNVTEALSAPDSKAYLMVSHGALCLGNDMQEAFAVASALEEVCSAYIEQRYLELSGSEDFDRLEFSAFITSLQGGNQHSDSDHFLGNSKKSRSGYSFTLYPDCPAGYYSLEGNSGIEVSLDSRQKPSYDQSLLPAVTLHREIYNRNRDFNALYHTLNPDVLTVSRLGKPLLPYLDDFAQIIGTRAPLIDEYLFNDHARLSRIIARKLRGRNALLLKGNGALCCGPTGSDAEAAAMIVDKNCKALIATILFGRGKPINPLECWLMRYIYLKRYARKANPT